MKDPVIMQMTDTSQQLDHQCFDFTCDGDRSDASDASHYGTDECFSAVRVIPGRKGCFMVSIRLFRSCST